MRHGRWWTAIGALAFATWLGGSGAAFAQQGTPGGKPAPAPEAPRSAAERVRAAGVPDEEAEEWRKAVEELPAELRAKLERIMRGEVEAAAALTSEDRAAIGRLPESLRAKLTRALPPLDRSPDRAGVRPPAPAALPAARGAAVARGPATPAVVVPASTPATLESLPLFGHALFAAGAIPPSTDLPVGTDYVVGPGDVLEARVWSQVEDTKVLEAEVAADGTATFPKIGPVPVRGQTLGAVETTLREALGRVYRDATIRVAIGRTRTVPVFVVGEVAAPGLHRVAAGGTVLHALLAAGGPSERGSLRRVSVTRRSGAPARFDLYAFLVQGDRGGDVRLEPEDVVHVPLRGPTAGVAGAVLRAARYELADPTTVADLLALAGGIGALGFQAGVQLERTAEGARRVLVDLPRERFAEPVQDGDLVRVASVAAPVRNVVEVQGPIERPGTYEWTEGLTVATLLARAGRLLPDAYRARADVFRPSGSAGAFRLQPGGAPVAAAEAVLKIDLGGLLGGDASRDVALLPLDRLVLYRRSEVDPALAVRISGEVHRPGEIPFAAGMRISDLIFRSGGAPPPTAHLERAELRRLAGEWHEYAYAEETERSRASRTALYVDLTRVLAGDADADLLLQPFDELVVWSEVDIRPAPTVTVSGAVQRPQTVELTSGMRASDLVRLAGGVLPDAFLGAAELVRRIYDKGSPGGYRIAMRTFPLGETLRGRPELDPMLENFDRVIVKQVTDYAVSVKIEGEVRYPGEYTLARGARLADVLVRAGGYKPDAFPEGAIFTRRSVKAAQEAAVARFLDEQRRQLLTLEAEKPLETFSADAAAKVRSALQARREMLEQLASTPVIGRLAVQFGTGGDFERSPRNLVLQDGDALTIPPVPASVTVQGQVYSPSTVVYEPGRGVRWYLDRTGGLREDADAERIHIVRPDGSARPLRSTTGRTLRWDPDSWRFIYGRVDATVGPGDVIIVPPDVQVVSGYDLTKDLVDIAFKIALAAGVVAGIG